MSNMRPIPVGILYLFGVCSNLASRHEGQTHTPAHLLLHIFVIRFSRST